MKAISRISIIALASGMLFTLRGQPVRELPPLTRDQIISTARQFAEHRWTCKERNRHAPCVPSGYSSDWKAQETVTGVPYDWGGMDSPEVFDRKLASGQAAGSHSRHGITDCTAGIDCSGFVCFCWGQPAVHEFSTQTIRSISGRPRYNWYTDMKPGDALNKPGSHVVLFAGYRPDGNPIVFEASGSAGRVILNDWSTWSRFKGYYPLQYSRVVQ